MTNTPTRRGRHARPTLWQRITLPVSPRRAVVALFAALAATAAVIAPASATGGEEVDQDTPVVDICDETQRPGGSSVAEWLEDEGFAPDEHGCVDFDVTVECGTLDVALDNKTGIFFEIRALVGTDPAYTVGEGTSTYPLTFDEDESGGSIDVRLWIEGGESDYLTGSNVPNFWDENAKTVTVNTNCLIDVAPVDPAFEHPNCDDPGTYTPATEPEGVDYTEAVELGHGDTGQITASLADDTVYEWADDVEANEDGEVVFESPIAVRNPCDGGPGPQGPEGPAGQDGSDGDDGKDGQDGDSVTIEVPTRINTGR